MVVKATFNARVAGALGLVCLLPACSAGETRSASARPAATPKTDASLAAPEPPPSSPPAAPPPEPVLRAHPVTAIANATRIGVGQAHACALLATGEVVCWGDGSKGQLGDETRGKRAAPAPVPGVADAVELDVFEDHACAVRAGGAVVCWGGRVPLPSTAVDPDPEIIPPVDVAGVRGAIAVSTSLFHACALLRTGKVVCFGDDAFERLGDVPARAVNGLVTVRSVRGAKAIATSNFGGCAIVGKGTLSCWGAGSITAWAPASPGYVRPKAHLEPTELLGVFDATAVSLYGVLGCLVRSSGEVKCWDFEALDMLPSNPLPDASTVAGVTDAAAIGGDLCVRGGGSIAEIAGGDGAGSRKYEAKPLLQEITTATRVAGSELQGCAIVDRGRVMCWGDL